jgi:hypothetical protein
LRQLTATQALDGTNLEPLQFQDDVNIDHAVELLAKLVADSSVQNSAP